MEWHRVASHLHMSVQRCKREHTYMDFLKMRSYLDKLDAEGYGSLHRSLAQISQYLAIAHFEKNDKYKDLDNFMVKVGREKPAQASVSETERKKAKALWQAQWIVSQFGFDPNQLTKEE